MASRERRCFSRIFFDAPCEIRQGDRLWPCQVLDISLQGVLLSCPEGFNGQAGEEYTVTIWLSDDTTSISMDVTLRHREDGRIGFECRFLDLDSVTHLRRLVELNLGDEAELHRELALLGDA